MEVADESVHMDVEDEAVDMGRLALQLILYTVIVL